MLAPALSIVFGCNRTGEHQADTGGSEHSPTPESTVEGTGATTTEGTGSGDDNGSGEGTGWSDSAEDIGEPVPLDNLPEDWPTQIPLPPNLEFERLSPPDSVHIFIDSRHPAPRRALLEWFLVHMSDTGWLVLDRDQLGDTSRVSFARGLQRWLVVVGGTTDDEGNTISWLNVRRQADGPAIESVPHQTDPLDCESALPVTPPRSGLWCDLQLGLPLSGLPEDVSEPDATAQSGTTALFFRSARQLFLLTIVDLELEREPTLVVDLELADATTAMPQLNPGIDGGWLLSWIDGEETERVADHFDQNLSRTERLSMSQGLGQLSYAAWVPIVFDRRIEYAAAWTEYNDDQLVFRVAGVKRDADRIRRSGRFPYLSSDPDVGPILAHDGDQRLGLIWSSADGIHFRAMGTDGLPDESEHRLEPGSADWLGAAHDNDSFWIAWRTSERGFWLRANHEGCRDNARGTLDGNPQQMWTTPFGPIVQVAEGNEIRLVRLSDLGSDQPDRDPEIVGSSSLNILWSDFEWDGELLSGVVQTNEGFAGGFWSCGEISGE